MARTVCSTSSRTPLLFLLLVLVTAPVTGFTAVQSTAFRRNANVANTPAHSSPLFSASASAPSTSGENELSVKEQKQEARRQQIRQEGGRFAFNTKYGALNPFAIYYGLVAIGLGIPWFIALSLYQVFSWVTRGKFDRQRFVPILINHIWGTLLMRLTRCYPKMENTEALKKFYDT